ncbi:hypothetical protein SAMN06265375_10134 [Muriicola jejuensis]|nr:hypothetical protein SAMN06265375_10134 [Muriicola jejuensis]
MERPIIEQERTLFTKTIVISAYTLLLGSALLLVFNYKQIPEQVSIFFNWPTKENGLANKDVLWVIPIIFSVISYFLFKLANRPWILNYPVKITMENARSQYSNASLMLRILSLLVAFTSVGLILGSVTVPNSLLNDSVKMFYSVLPYIFFGLPFFFAFRLFVRGRK